MAKRILYECFESTMLLIDIKSLIYIFNFVIVFSKDDSFLDGVPRVRIVFILKANLKINSFCRAGVDHV